jgi:excisionase family DNA binding protein
MADAIALSVKETARQTGLSRSFLYLEIGRGKLQTLKIGNRRLVRTADITAYLDAHKVAA